MRFLSLCLLLFATHADARVFNINNIDFATYFKGSYGHSLLRDNAYEKSSGAQTTFSEGAKFNWGGEVGFAFPTPHFTMKIGLNILAPHVPSDTKGTDTSGTELMSLDSSVYGIFPVAHLVYYIINKRYGRFFFSIGGGYGKVTMKNDYTFTAAGDAAYAPLTSFTEKASQTTYLIESSFGIEMGFAHAVTVLFDIGYRYSVAKNLKYEGAGTTFNGSHNEGDPVLNSDGSQRSLDLGGVFTGLSFRFYFN